MLMGGQGTKCRRNIAENYKRLSRVHERYRGQTTDRRTDKQTDRQRVIAQCRAMDWIRFVRSLFNRLGLYLPVISIDAAQPQSSPVNVRVLRISEKRITHLQVCRPTANSLQSAT